MIDDEKIMVAGEAPKKEDAAPAPASALETATTSVTTDSDITTDNSSVQDITESNTGVSPAQPITPDRDDYLDADGEFSEALWVEAVRASSPYGPLTVAPRALPAWLDEGLGLGESPYRFRRIAPNSASLAKLRDEVVRACAYWIATASGPGCPSIFTEGEVMALDDVVARTVKEVNIAIEYRNRPIVGRSHRWAPVNGITGYEAGILALAYFSWPETGRLVMQAAATSTAGEPTAEEASQGYLRHFDPNRRWWDTAEAYDGSTVVGWVRKVFDRLVPGGSDREFNAFHRVLRQYAEVVNPDQFITSHEVDPHLSIVREEGTGRGVAWNRATGEIAPLTGELVELAYDRACSGVFMADDGTGHVVKVDAPTYRVRTARGREIDWSAERDLFPSMFTERDREAGVEMCWQLMGYHVSRSASNRQTPYLFGPRGAGKSVLLEIVRDMCGGNVADVGMDEFGNEKAMMTVPGSVAVVSDDNAPGARISSLGAKRFKSFASQGIVSLDPLFHGRRSFRARQRCYQAGNQRIYTDDRSGAIGGGGMGARKVDFEFAHSFYDDDDYVPAVVEWICHDPALHTWIAQQAAERDPIFDGFDMSNPILARTNAAYEDENDWVRGFASIFMGQLDDAGVDCITMQALYEAFKSYYRSYVSASGPVPSFDREFRLSVVRKLAEMGWTVRLDGSDQFAVAWIKYGFYEPDRLYDVLADYTEMRGIDDRGRALWANENLMKWADWDKLKSGSDSGRKNGLLDKKVRGVAYRVSALQSNETPARRHARERAESHARDWARAKDETREAYVKFVNSCPNAASKRIVDGSDFAAFGLSYSHDSAYDSPFYRDERSGLPFVVPTIGEWDELGCPTVLALVRQTMRAVDIRARYRCPDGTLRVAYREQYVPSLPCEVSDDDPDDDPDDPGSGAPTLSDTDTGANSDNVSAAQEPMKDSEPAGAPDAGPAASGKAPAENGPSAPAEAVDSPADEDAGGDDAAEEAPGAPDPGYEAFVRHAEGAVEHSGGYVVLDGGPEGTTVCREVIDEDEWAAYGRPTSLRGTVVIDGERLPLIE